MRSGISVPLAGLFVFLAGLNAWIMLSGRGSRNFWAQVHRAAGYTFIALYVTFCYFMLLRIRGQADELSPRIILHMGLALALVPLLLVKVVAVRSQQAAWGLLQALGIAILSMAFTLVAINVSVHYFRNISAHKIAAKTSELVIISIVAACAVAFLTRKRSI